MTIREKVMEKRRAYRATLDKAGRGSEEAYRAMQAAEAEWEAEAAEAEMRTNRELDREGKS